MIRDLMRDSAKDLPVTDPQGVAALRIWHCKYGSLDGIARFTDLRTLVIATYPDSDLAPLSNLANLEYLAILHLPNVSDLAPLSDLPALRTIRLSTLASWDSSGKVTTVESLRPLGDHPNLEHLELFGVRPETRSLGDLEGSATLQTVRVSKYPKAEVNRFYAVSGVSDAFAPGPGVADWH